MNRLPNKKYFKKFTNKEEGIPEANAKDEDTQTVDESEADRSEKRERRRRRGDKGRGPNSPLSGGEGSALSGESAEDKGDGEDDDEDDEEGGSDSDYDDQDRMSGEDEGDQEGASASDESEGGADGEIITPKSMRGSKTVNVEAAYMNANGILVDEDQLAKERAYIQPTESEFKTKYKLSRMPIRQKLESAQALLLNYVESDYR